MTLAFVLERRITLPKKKKPIPNRLSPQESQVKDFFDMIAPGAVKFNVDHIICGDTYRCIRQTCLASDHASTRRRPPSRQSCVASVIRKT